jgi:NTP pyrophosphatase (non-canonical NTP hydrolase)
MDELTFKRFQQVNLDRCNEGFRHSVDNWSLLEWAGAMCGEAGEAANVCKKLLRKKQKIGGTWADKDPEERALLGQLSEEIGDVITYLSLLADAAGLDLEKCVALKFDHVSDKAGWAGPRLARAAREE